MSVAFKSGNYGSGSGGTSFSAANPTGISTGDCLVAIVGSTASDATNRIPPAGWSVVPGWSSNNNTAAFFKFGSPADSGATSVFNNAGNRQFLWLIAVFTGVVAAPYYDGISYSYSTPISTQSIFEQPGGIFAVLSDDGNGSYPAIATIAALPANGVNVISGLVTPSVNAGIAATFVAMSTAGNTPTTSFNATSAAAGYLNRAATIYLPSNVAPNAAGLTSPANNAVIDRTLTQRLAWTVSDPNAGDTQSKFDLQYRVGAAAWTLVTQPTSNQFWDAPATPATFTNNIYEWQVRTYDAAGLVGPWSASRFFTAAGVVTFQAGDPGSPVALADVVPGVMVMSLGAGMEVVVQNPSTFVEGQFWPSSGGATGPTGAASTVPGPSGPTGPVADSQDALDYMGGF